MIHTLRLGGVGAPYKRTAGGILIPNPVHVSTGSATAAGGTGGGYRLAAPLPADYAIDDVLLLYVFVTNTFYGFSGPADGGWTQIMADSTASGSIAHLYGRRVRRVPEVIPRFIFSAPNGAYCAVQVAAFRGIDVCNPLRAAGTLYSSSSSANIGPIPAPVNGANDLIVFLGGRHYNASSVATLSGDSLTWVEVGEYQIASSNNMCYVWGAATTTDTPPLTSKTFTPASGSAAITYGRSAAFRKRPIGDDPYVSGNKSLLHFNAANGSTTFTDVVAGNTWTAVGDAVIDTSKSKFGSSSMRLSGAGYIDGSNITMLTGNEWTIDAWVWFNTLGPVWRSIYSQYHSAAAARTLFAVYDGKLRLHHGNYGDAIGTTTLSTGQWYHIRFVREGASVCKGYVNGMLELVHQDFHTPHSTGEARIGGAYNGGITYSLDGWIDEFRITGIARVFSPHTALLFNFNGADASTTMTDESALPPTWTASGNAQLDTAKSKFGTASLLLDGANDWISTVASVRHGAEGRDYTVAGWVWINAWQSNTAPIISNIAYYPGTYEGWGLRLYYSPDGSAGFNHFYYSNNGISATAPAGSLTLGAWHHIAACRQGATLRLYINGVQTGTGSIGGNGMQGSNLRMTIGYAMDPNDTTPAPAGYGVNGWLDGLEYVIGECMYPDGTTFTPPTTAPVPRGIGTSYFAVPIGAYPDT